MSKLFVCGYMMVDEEGSSRSALSINNSFERSKEILALYLDEDLREFLVDAGEEANNLNTLFFLVEQTPNSALTHFDPDGGVMGEIILNGDYKEIYMFEEFCPSIEIVEQAIEAVKNL